MKKILLLGGSAQQVVAIESAKKLGYFTILCDYLPDNPGQFVADKFYLKSTTDKEEMLNIAVAEKIDGVLAYASDPAAPTAAYIAEKMGLPTNPYVAVDTLCNKDKFRLFLKENGFATPLSCGYEDKQIALSEKNNFTLPIIIKPVDSSGSKGATVLREWADFEKALDFAFSFSRSGRVIVEEFIEKKHDYLIGGDVFIINGKIEIWGLMNCHRDSTVNPLVPVGKSYPLSLESADIDNVKKTLQRMVDCLHLKNGAMNVELIVDSKGRVIPIDIGPRSGGNMIPDLMGYIFNVNIPELSVKVAMGEYISLDDMSNNCFFATHNLHSSINGTFKNIVFDSEIEKYIVRKSIYKKEGDKVEYFDNAAKALGIIFLKFNSNDEMFKVLNKVNSLISYELGDA